MYCDGRPGSLVGLHQMIGERLSILTVCIAREVVVLLSFSVNLSRKPEVIKSIPMFQNDEPNGIMGVCGSFSKGL